MASINFVELRRLISLESVVPLIRPFSPDLHTNSTRGPCLLAPHNDLHAVSYSWGKNLWFCHRCKRGGGPLQLYGYVNGMNPYQAAIEICLALGIKVPWMKRQRTAPTNRWRKPTGPLANE